MMNAQLTVIENILGTGSRTSNKLEKIELLTERFGLVEQLVLVNKIMNLATLDATSLCVLADKAKKINAKIIRINRRLAVL